MYPKTKKFELGDFEKNSFIMIVLTTLSSGLNYLSQIIMGKVMEVSSFGTMNTIFSLILVLNVFGTSINMITAKRIAERNDDVLECAATARAMTQLSLIVGAAIFAVVSICGCICASFLRMAPITLALTGGIIATNLFPYIISGFLAGKGAFIKAGLFSMVVPIFKMCGVLTAYMWAEELHKQVWILSSMVVGNLVAIVLFRRALYPRLTDRLSGSPSENKRLFDGDLFFVTSLNFLYLLFANADILLINQFCGSEEGGIYSASMLFGRIIFYFTTAVVAVLLPYAAKEKQTGGSTARVFRGSALMVLAACAVCIIPLNWRPELFIRLLYGERYLPAVRYIPFSCGIAVIISQLNLELNYFIGIGREKKILIDQTVTLLVMLLLLLWRHGTPQDILIDLLVALTGLVIYELPLCMKKDSAERSV